MLEGLLMKSPIFTKNVFGPFMEEIERIKNDFSTRINKLEIYIESKFLVHFNKDLVEYIFKNLWKIVFKNNSDRERKNRDINYRVLIIIYEKNKNILFDYIRKESDYFSDFLDGNSLILKKLVNFLSKFPNVYSVFKEHTQEILKNRINADFQLFIQCYFLSASLKNHLQKIDDIIHLSYGNYFNTPYTQKYWLKKEDITFLYSLSSEQQVLEGFYDLMISHYYHSDSFDGADICFDNCIRPYYKEFNKTQFELLLKEANSNPQCYGGKYGSRNKILVETANSLLEDVEEHYKNLFT